jgi:hypothetical protein
VGICEMALKMKFYYNAIFWSSDGSERAHMDCGGKGYYTKSNPPLSLKRMV